MPRSRQPENPLDRIRAALDEWLDAFEAESSDLVRAELAKISETDTPEMILVRLEAALAILDDEAARIQKRGEEERDKAMALERQAMESIRSGDDNAARNALSEQSVHQDLATEHFDRVLQLNWLLEKYRTAAAAVRDRDSG